MRGRKMTFPGIFVSVGALLMLSWSSLADVPLNEITPSPSTARLRVFVLPLTGTPPPGGWGKPHADFARNQYRATRRILEGTGIYEIPTREKVQTVIGRQAFTPADWRKNGWALAKRVGQALSADYLFVVERAFNSGYLFYETWLLNLGTGKQFRVSFRVPKGGEHREEWQQVGRLAYAEIFQDAKEDMLATALRKGRPAPAAPVGKPEKAAPIPPKTREVDLEEVLTKKGGQPAARLAVYDFSASESHQVVALILSEALREEISLLGTFTLVNRENIVQILNEMGIQQTGLVDESAALRAGKGLAAQQVVLGQFGVVGNTSVLQAKRIDLETQGTLALGSVKCAQGKEEELLSGLRELAQKLAGRK